MLRWRTSQVRVSAPSSFHCWDSGKAHPLPTTSITPFTSLPAPFLRSPYPLPPSPMSTDGEPAPEAAPFTPEQYAALREMFGSAGGIPTGATQPTEGQPDSAPPGASGGEWRVLVHVQGGMYMHLIADRVGHGH